MASTINGHPTPQPYPALARSGSDMTAFDSRPPSFTSMPSQSQQIQYGNMTNHSQQGGQSNGSGPYRNFSEVNGTAGHHQVHNPQIYTAVYSGVAVYEMEVHGVAIMRRRSDSWLNATQILKVAGVEKGKRTKILEKEILTGTHEKIQGGYGKYQGTWINYNRGREFCRQYGVEDLLRPLLDYDIGADGTGLSGQGDTPTKEQAMAANRKRFYNSSIDNRSNGQVSGGTFFQNISPMASNALAAINKAARFDSPMSRPGSAQRRPGSGIRRTSVQQSSQENNHQGGSQQSMQSFTSDYGASGQDSVYANGPTGNSQEPPRKRMRPSSSQEIYSNPSGNVDISMHEGSPTEPNDSSTWHSFDLGAGHGLMSLPPLPAPTEKAGEEKRLALLDLFADLSQTDYSAHTAIMHLQGRDLDIPLDQSANTALHWAATLARVPLMRLLLKNGANMFVGNVAGQTPLMAAVQVKNCYDRTCFPEILELLGPLIEFRDAAGRTILHHVALTCGVSNRGSASKYYLEALLEFTVRNGGSNPASQQTSFTDGPNTDAPQAAKSIGIARFMSEVVNAQDKSGNTALNLVARIGNRVIIRQLQEVGADASIPNNRGFRAVDFGVTVEGQEGTTDTASDPTLTSSQVKAQVSQVEQMKEEILAATTSILTQTQSQYATELRNKQSTLDATTAALRDISSQHSTELARADTLRRRAKDAADRVQKIANLRRAQDEQRRRLQSKGVTFADDTEETVQADIDHLIDPALLALSDSASVSAADKSLLAKLPSPSTLRARLAAYTTNNSHLESEISALKARSSDLEGQYRRVVALCTGVAEASVEETLEGLLAAVESEDGAMGGGVGATDRVRDVGRVREFLRKVEGVVGVGVEG